MVSDGTEVRLEKENYELFGYVCNDSKGVISPIRYDNSDKEITKIYETIMFSDINTGEFNQITGKRKLTELLYRSIETGEEKTLSFNEFKKKGRPYWFEVSEKGRFKRKV